MCVLPSLAWLVPKEAKRVSYLLELEFQSDVSYHVGAENGTKVLCKKEDPKPRTKNQLEPPQKGGQNLNQCAFLYQELNLGSSRITVDTWRLHPHALLLNPLILFIYLICLCIYAGVHSTQTENVAHLVECLFGMHRALGSSLNTT